MCNCRPQLFSRCNHLQLNLEPCAGSKNGTELCFIPVHEAEYDAKKNGFLETDDYCNDCTEQIRNALHEGVSRRDIGASERSNPSSRSHLAKLCGYEWIGETRVKNTLGVEQVIKRFRLWGQTVTCEWYYSGYFPKTINVVSEAPDLGQ